MQTFIEFDAHLMSDNKPSNYFIELSKTGIFEVKHPYTLLGDLMKVPQSPKHHPEGNVWNHTMLVLDNAGERKHLSQNPKVLMWSSTLASSTVIPLISLVLLPVSKVYQIRSFFVSVKPLYLLKSEEKRGQNEK